MDYIEYQFRIEPLNPGSEILIAELGQAGFESFLETGDGIRAYIQKQEWNKDILSTVQILKSDEFTVSFDFSEIKQVNWNKAWEENFDLIKIADKCTVRAPFHEKQETEFDIVIEPKMSFGTGHHETTYMMLRFILEADFEQKTVLDMGCGTAVLAILAELKGAQKVDAIDIDPWCVENATENIIRNHAERIEVSLGDAGVLTGKKYDRILANINRNILIQDMKAYVQAMNNEASLYVSGFYLEDLELIRRRAEELGLQFVEKKEKNKWIAARFIKKN